MESPFTQQTIKSLRSAYGYSCSVCLIRQTTTGSQCAHLYASAEGGQDQVKEATLLGLLDPTPENEYNRSSSDNGTIQCATCHAGYFTPGFVAFSPPLPILKWIWRKLKSLDSEQADAQAVWEIFDLLKAEEVPELNRLHHLYSLIPRFDPGSVSTAERYDIHCDLPPIQVVDENGKFATIARGRIPNPWNSPRFRIFDVQDTLRRRSDPRGMGVRPGLISLFPAGILRGPVNYWRLPVPCHIMLYLFIDAVKARDFDRTVPEVKLVMKIYKRLTEIRSNNDEEFEPERKKELDHPTHTPSPVGTPSGTPRKHRECRHLVKDNCHKYCLTCYTLSPKNSPPSNSLQTDTVEEMTPSRPALTRTQHTRPRTSYGETAYPTPSSLPKPGHEGGADYFSNSPTRNCTQKLSTARSFSSGARSADSPSVVKPSSASRSKQKADCQPSEDSRSSGEWEIDSDTAAFCLRDLRI